MKKILVAILSVIMLSNVSMVAFASTQTLESDMFIMELEKAIEDSPVLNSENYEINVSATGESAMTMYSIREIINYLEAREETAQSCGTQGTITQPYQAINPLASDVVMTVSYWREFITKYTLSANVTVNPDSGRISKITSPRYTVTGGYGISLEDKTFETDIMDANTVAYIGCYYTEVSEIKIPGVTDVEIRRKNYYTYMHYRYDEVFDTGNEEV